MSIKAAVLSHLQQVADEQNRTLPPLTDDLVLIDSGLDSLGIAILVARLEDALGIDPFISSGTDDAPYPVTLGDFVRLYERGVETHGIDTRVAG
jgi:aryl carrier-like protein